MTAKDFTSMPDAETVFGKIHAESTVIQEPLTSTPQPGGFDYGDLEPALANEVRTTAARMRQRTYDSYIENGRDLIAIKNRLEHGSFHRWIDAEFDMSERTARNLMAAAELVEGKSAIIAGLPVTALYQLAAPSTPEHVRDAIVARVESGDIPP